MWAVLGGFYSASVPRLHAAATIALLLGGLLVAQGPGCAALGNGDEFVSRGRTSWPWLCGSWRLPACAHRWHGMHARILYCC